MPLSLIPLSLRGVLNNNRADQKALQGLGKFPNVLKLLKDLMADDVPFENFPLNVWRFKSEALAWGSLESNFFSAIAIILTDFWGLFQRLDFNKSHESRVLSRPIRIGFSEIRIVHGLENCNPNPFRKNPD
ncbi:hypothetical protein BDC45DRAFT_575809 [Circinella umbellata]|nr:hypothetical protein BDC45DRAFT_575809 [Circinella umbellata]